jgi:hypothetical protein
MWAYVPFCAGRPASRGMCPGPNHPPQVKANRAPTRKKDSRPSQYTATHT